MNVLMKLLLTNRFILTDELPKPFVSVPTNNANLTVTEGSDAKLSCVVTQLKTYNTSNAWIVGNSSSGVETSMGVIGRHAQTINIEYSNETTVMIMLNLTIRNISLTDQGWYICRSVYFFYNVTRKVFLTVLPTNKQHGHNTGSGKYFVM